MLDAAMDAHGSPPLGVSPWYTGPDIKVGGQQTTTATPLQAATAWNAEGGDWPGGSGVGKRKQPH